MLHKTCGTEYIVSPNEFIYTGRRCPKCKAEYISGTKSKGEIKISKFLDKYEYKYDEQVTFSDLIYKNYLKFDFVLSDYNIIIEYDGKQHFFPMRNTEEGVRVLKEQQIRDNIKDK
jgi:hypothetical protein